MSESSTKVRASSNNAIRTVRAFLPLISVFGTLLAHIAPAVDVISAKTLAQHQGSKGSLRKLAFAAMDDLHSHWWIGDEKTGHFMPTHGGMQTSGEGVIWERAMLVCAQEGLCVATGDPGLRQRIRTQWAFDKAQYTPDKLEACGPGSPSPWCDDASWTLLYYVIAFQQSGDTAALDRARGLIRNIHRRWYDNELGGGLWYNDQRRVKALYATAFVYGCLGVFESTHDRDYLNLALEEYQWIETHLLRTDHLYWCEFSSGSPADAEHSMGPVGSDRPNQIHPSGSVVYLGGNMGMGACQAYLFQLTGDNAYRQAAFRTAAALQAHLVDNAGRFINDRDAFTNGVFASFWARRMLALPGVDHGCLATLATTASSIAASRTTKAYLPASGSGGEGFYPADWDGGAVWENKGSAANMMHVSGCSVSLLVAATYDE